MIHYNISLFLIEDLRSNNGRNLQDIKQELIIKLDWDNITISEARKRIRYIMEDRNVGEIELWQSATSGYHVIITLVRKPSTQNSCYYYRKIWKDDGRRLVLDVLIRSYETPKDILFTSKTINEIKWSRHLIDRFRIQ